MADFRDEPTTCAAPLPEVVRRLHLERLHQCEQWSLVFTALAMAGPMGRGHARDDLLFAAYEIAHELGAGDDLAQYLPELTEAEDRAATARGLAVLRALPPAE